MPRQTTRNIITSDELINQINKDSKALVDQFLKTKAIKVAEKTIDVYRSNLNIFFCWNILHNDNKFFISIKKLEFANFFSFCSEELEIGTSRLNNLRSTLSSFSTFIERFYDEDYPDFRNVILSAIESSPKEQRREKTILTDEQVDELLTYLSKKDKQIACWIALAATSGARFSELLRFKLEHIDEDRLAFGDIFLETTNKIRTKGRGKKGKLIYKYILRDKFLPYYHPWLKERKKIMKKYNQDHDDLFIKLNGQPATEAVAREWVKICDDFLGVPFYVHSLRHYLTTLLSKKNIPHSLIKEIFGWEDISLVGVYDDSSAKDREYPELENLKDL